MSLIFWKYQFLALFEYRRCAMLNFSLAWLMWLDWYLFSTKDLETTVIRPPTYQPITVNAERSNHFLFLILRQQKNSFDLNSNFYHIFKSIHFDEYCVLPSPRNCKNIHLICKDLKVLNFFENQQFFANKMYDLFLLVCLFVCFFLGSNLKFYLHCKIQSYISVCSKPQEKDSSLFYSYTRNNKSRHNGIAFISWRDSLNIKFYVVVFCQDVQVVFYTVFAVSLSTLLISILWRLWHILTQFNLAVKSEKKFICS